MLKVDIRDYKQAKIANAQSFLAANERAIANTSFLLLMAAGIISGAVLTAHMLRWLGEGDRILYLIKGVAAWFGPENAFVLTAIMAATIVTGIIIIIAAIVAFFGPILIAWILTDEVDGFVKQQTGINRGYYRSR